MLHLWALCHTVSRPPVTWHPAHVSHITCHEAQEMWRWLWPLIGWKHPVSPDSGLRMVTLGTIITTSWHISLTPEVSSQDVSYKLKTLVMPFSRITIYCRQSRSSRLLLLGRDIREANVSVWRSDQINHPDPDPWVMSKDSFRQLPVSLLQCLCIVNIFSMFCCECFDIRGDKTCWISHSQSMENEGGEMS